MLKDWIFSPSGQECSCASTKIASPLLPNIQASCMGGSSQIKQEKQRKAMQSGC